MNVLMVAYTFYEADNRVRRYAETLARRGDSVEAIALRQKGQPFKTTLNGVTVYHIQGREINERTKFDYLFRILLFLFHSMFFIGMRQFKRKYKLIHVHSVPDFEVFAAVVPKILGAKVILDIHDIVSEFYASKFHSGADSLFSKALKIIERVCCSFSDHVIISNHIWGKRIVERSVPQRKCSVILNYPDPHLFNRTRLKEDSEKFIIMYPGTIAWHQGIDIAVRAMALLKEKNPRIEFHIYGKGPEENNILKLIDELGVNDTVKNLGGAPLEEIADKMMSVDLGIVPKRGDNFGGEAFSTKILEFMALGVPVLIAETRIDRYYFNDDLVTFFKGGDERDLAEKILFLSNNRPHLKEQCARASAYIEKNTWDVRKDEYIDLITAMQEKP
jgi:glycosyltransferase involved in cell wall biosynthesis